MNLSSLWQQLPQLLDQWNNCNISYPICIQPSSWNKHCSIQYQISTWWRDAQDPSSPRSHLDSDIVLAFPSEDTSTYPNFYLFTQMFADDNSFFLQTFLLALDKLSKLGVMVTLQPPGDCDACSPQKVNSLIRNRSMMSDEKSEDFRQCQLRNQEV